MQRVEPLPSSGYNPRVLRRLQPMGLAVWLGQGALVPGTGGVIGVGLKDEVLTGGKHHGHDTTTVSPRRGGNRRCSQGRHTVAAGATELIHACRDASVKYAGERKTWGVEIGQHQLVKAMIAQVESNYQASRLL